MKINDLTITQKGFRSPWQLPQMVEHAALGGKFDVNTLNRHSSGKDVRLINLVRFEDGRVFIHDGHHRVMAIYLGARDFLGISEYALTDWKYKDYTDIVFAKRWITPFDPRFEVRVSDYTEFKNEVWSIWEKDGEEAAKKHILLHKEAYVMPRCGRTIADMIKDF
jgi:hypothetical protein